MARSISCVIRKTDLIGLVLAQRPGKIGFRFGFARNFDGAFTTFQVVPNHGFRSVSVPPLAFQGPFTNQVGFIFRPSDYTATHATLIDGVPLFLRVEAQNPNGSFDAPEAMHLIIPNQKQPNAPFMLRGTAPNGAALANSVEIQLPGRCMDWQFKVDTGSNLEVAFDSGGPEFVVLPESTTGHNFAQIYTSISQVFIRGAGGTSTFSSVFTLANSPV